VRVVAQIRHPRVTIVPGRCNVEIVDYHQEGAHRIAQARHPRFFFQGPDPGVTRYRLARELVFAAQRIGDIVAGPRAITADTDLRRCRVFGLTNGYWLRAQIAHDTEVAAKELAAALRSIKPWAESAAQYSRAR